MTFTRFGWFAAKCCIISLFAGAGAMVRAEPPPATQPAENRQMYRGDPETILQRFQQQIDSLKLSDAQKEQVRAAGDKAEQSIKMLDDELQNATPAQRMSRVREIFKEFRESLQSILSEEQQKELRSKIGAEGAIQLQRLHDALAKLHLTDVQKRQIESVFADIRARVEAARAAASGQSAGKTATTQPRPGELLEKLREILSDDQIQQLRDLMENGRAPTTQPAK